MFNPQKEAAKKFIHTWIGRGYEKGEAQSFWYQLLHDVFGVDTPASFISFELPIHLKTQKFIDAYIPSTKVIIEQKSSSEDLLKSKKQSDNKSLTPYEQALRYSTGLKYSERPRWIVTCNFKSFLIYDMERPEEQPFEILLENFEREYHLLRFLVEETDTALKHEKEVSIKAGALMGELYHMLAAEYCNPASSISISSLNILSVRLMFCLFAEDSGLFGQSKGAFRNYLLTRKPSQMRKALIELFKILDTPYDLRDPYEEPDLLAFPYVNGGLFKNNHIEIPTISPQIANRLIVDCSQEFDWSSISPTIFGALFEDTMNPETRVEGAMHYTSVENIHRVIDPLFIWDINHEFKIISQIPVDRERLSALTTLHDKISNIKILDPACGSGNFLTESYLSLRKIENGIIEQRLLLKDENLNLAAPIKIAVENFYGIEINNFAVTVAKAALWIAEAQMMRETEVLIKHNLDFLPLRSQTNIFHKDALTCNWASVVNPQSLTFIIGNPPFRGKKTRSYEQKTSLLTAIANDSPRPGNMDLASGWFVKAARYIANTNIRVCFVSTVNITRGEQAFLLWDSLLNKHHCEIQFAYKPFLWNSESSNKAQVHCVIICFSQCHIKHKQIFQVDNETITTSNISPYIRAEETVLIDSRKKPICDVPHTGIGNKPIDGGYFLFSEVEMHEFLNQEPEAEKFFYRWFGAEELIKGTKRYFLWLAGCSPSLLRSMPMCKARIEAVREFRSKSVSKSTRDLALYPTRFHVSNIPDADFIVIPEVTSEHRRYIPMEYVKIADNEKKLFSNLVKLMPNGTLFHFGILQSDVHMIWAKAVCGYKDYRPRYSTDVVFNNFPWPDITDIQKERISFTASKILDARHYHPECSLADLYDDSTMPDDLREAHWNNDKAVRMTYGFSMATPEEEIIAELLKLYKHKTGI